MRKLIVAAIALGLTGLLAALALPLLLVTALTAAASAQACGGQLTGAPSAIPAGRPASAQTMSPTQLGNAKVIVAVGEQMQISQQGIVIALAVASQESTFLNYANDGLGNDLNVEQLGVARSQVFPHDAVGSDHGSVNAFQQQFPWWGTLEQLMDPPTAARLFYEALRKIPNVESLPVTEAAQRVQRSAYPAAYADDEPLARDLLAQLAGSGLAADPDETPGEAVPIGLCGTGGAMNCPPTQHRDVEVGLSPDALRVLRCVQQTFGDHTYAGVGNREDNPRSDHPAGRAVDIMIDAWDTPAGNTSGRLVAEWVAQNAAGLGVKYVIFDGQQWNSGQPPQTWTPYTHPKGLTDPNSMHRNHVHVSVYGNAAQTGGALSAAGWMLPLPPGSYRLSSGFGPRQSPGGIGSTLHAGIDFAARSGAPVFAAASGTVTHAGPSGGYGNLVVITTGNVETYYAHMLDSSIAVTRGQLVRRRHPRGRRRVDRTLHRPAPALRDQAQRRPTRPDRLPRPVRHRPVRSPRFPTWTLWVAAAAAATAGVLLLQSPSPPQPQAPAAPASTAGPAPINAGSPTGKPSHRPEPPVVSQPSPAPASALPLAPITSSSPTSMMEPLAAPPWEPIAHGFASAFTQPGSSHADWMARVTPWITPYLSEQYQNVDHRRLPTATLTELTPTVVGETSVEFLGVYDTGLQLLCRAELGPGGWQITDAQPAKEGRSAAG